MQSLERPASRCDHEAFDSQKKHLIRHTFRCFRKRKGYPNEHDTRVVEGEEETDVKNAEGSLHQKPRRLRDG